MISMRPIKRRCSSAVGFLDAGVSFQLPEMLLQSGVFSYYSSRTNWENVVDDVSNSARRSRTLPGIQLDAIRCANAHFTGHYNIYVVVANST